MYIYIFFVCSLLLTYIRTEGDLTNAAKKKEWDNVLDLIARRREYAIDVNEIDKDGRTAASYAAMYHAFHVLRQLQQCGADMKHSDINGVSIGRYLNQINEDDKCTAAVTCTQTYTYACKMGKASDLHFAISLGADISAFDGNDVTPLMHCAKEGEVDCSKALFEHGVDLNQQNSRGMSAVMFAAAFGRKACVELLCTQGANVLLEDTDGKKAIDHALEGNETESAKILHNYMKSASDSYKQQSEMKKEERHIEIVKKLSAADLQRKDRAAEASANASAMKQKDLVPDSVENSLKKLLWMAPDRINPVSPSTEEKEDYSEENVKVKDTPVVVEDTKQEVQIVPEKIPETFVADDRF
ncbi:ankyrin repeat protein [Reticulomyxa filosa]|uniref:Ankyrin repeat protein n=1 Tax=Reticulomyxa filosa TaxID=46433 RepID=X6N0J7_RETFI|nr:ankyrin repeat protein [Reticulomyxa filosa]|eukprot:ETO19596.1 ankyrin repeat protein [Reticulomyxa filosa]